MSVLKRYLFIFTLLSGSVKAQERLATIKASVADSLSKEVLVKATIRLSRLPDFITVARLLSDKKEFIINGLQAGHYVLSVSYVGYIPYKKEIHITKTDSVYNLRIIELVREQGTMTTVVIKSVIPPVIVRSDTIVYNTSAYKTRINASVEELLRKLPGVQIDEDGTIKVNGQKVETIYIDGKEFLINDPKLATRTLSADMIEAVEAYRGGSERSRLTGIKDMDGKQILNLKIKKHRNQGLSGNMYGAYGSENGYSIGGLVHYFKGDRWLSGQFNSNSISGLFMGSDHKQGRPGAVLQQSITGSLNYKDQWNTNVDANASYAGNDIQSDLFQTSNRQTFFSDSTLLQKKFSSHRNKMISQNFRAEIEWKMDSFSKLVFSPAFNFKNSSSVSIDTQQVNTEKMRGTSPLNDAFSFNNQKSNSYNVNNRLSYGRRFSKKGRYIFAKLSQGYHKQKGNGSLQSLTRFYQYMDTVEQKRDQLSRQKANGSHYGLNIMYGEPLAKGKILDIGYSLSYSKNLSDNIAMNYNELTRKYEQIDSLQTNAFKNTTTIQKFSVGYNHIATKLNYQLGLAAQYVDMDNRSLKGANNYASIHQQMINWYPRASLMYQTSRRKYLGIDYQGSSQQPTIEQLQPLPDVTNPLITRLGNPSLKQQFNHNLSINYSLLNSKTLKSLMLTLSSQVTGNKMAEANMIKQGGVQELQYVNVNGVYSFNSQLTYSFPLSTGGKNGNGSFSSGINYNRDISLINRIGNIRKGITLEQTAQFNYNVGDNLYLTMNGSLNYSAYNYSIQQNFNTSLLNQNYFLDASYQLPAGLLLSTNIQWLISGAQGSLPGQTITLWNAALSKNLFNNKGELRLSGFDLLNNNGSFAQEAEENYMETRQSNLLQRLFLLSFLYRFNTSGVKENRGK